MGGMKGGIYKMPKAPAPSPNPLAPEGSGVVSSEGSRPVRPGNVLSFPDMKEYMKKLAEWESFQAADPAEFGEGMAVTDSTQAQRFVEGRQADKDMARTESLIAKRRRLAMVGGFGRGGGRRRVMAPSMLGFGLSSPGKTMIGA